MIVCWESGGCTPSSRGCTRQRGVRGNVGCKGGVSRLVVRVQRVSWECGGCTPSCGGCTKLQAEQWLVVGKGEGKIMLAEKGCWKCGIGWRGFVARVEAFQSLIDETKDFASFVAISNVWNRLPINPFDQETDTVRQNGPLFSPKVLHTGFLVLHR